MGAYGIGLMPISLIDQMTMCLHQQFYLRSAAHAIWGSYPRAAFSVHFYLFTM